MSLVKSWWKWYNSRKASRCVIKEASRAALHISLLQAEFVDHLEGLQQHLLTLEDLHNRYESYQTAFNKLLIEIARRRQYREAAEIVVRRMSQQLDAMTDGASRFCR